MQGQSYNRKMVCIAFSFEIADFISNWITVDAKVALEMENKLLADSGQLIEW